MKKLNYRPRGVPVLGEADAVVVGGSLAGLACALELAARANTSGSSSRAPIWAGS